VLSVEVSLVLNRATVVLALPCDGDDNVAIDVIDEGQVYEGEEKETQSLLGVGKRGKRKTYPTPADVVEAVEDAGFEGELLSVTKGWDKGGADDATDGLVTTKIRFDPMDSPVRSKVLDITSSLKTMSPDLTDKLDGSIISLSYTPVVGVGPRTLERYFKFLLRKECVVEIINDEPPPSSSYSRVSKELESKKNYFVTAFVLTLPVFLFSMILPMLFPQFMSPLTAPFYNGVAPVDLLLLAFSTPVQFCCGWTFYKGALKSIRNSNLGMDMLVVVGTTASYGYGVFSIAQSALGDERNGGSEFLETSCVLLTFVLMGKYLQTSATRSTSKALQKLGNLTPPTAILVTRAEVDLGGSLATVERINDCFMEDSNFLSPRAKLKEIIVPLKTVQVGDIVKLTRGGSIPCDGRVLKTFNEGGIAVNEGMITGESMPVYHVENDTVIAGTVMVEGTAYARVESTGEGTVINKIVRLMEKAQGGKAPIQHFADRISAAFVPFVLGTSTITLIVWLVLSWKGLIPLEWTNGSSYGVFSAKFAVSTLVIACPCALGLAAPTAVMVGTGVGARNGVLFKGGDVMESTAKVDCVIMDKTGTLTEGRCGVEGWTYFGKSGKEEEVFYFAWCLEVSSEHPLAVAVVEYCKKRLEDIGSKRGDSVHTPEGWRGVTGMGVEGTIDRKKVAIGNRAFMKLLNVEVPQKIESQLQDMEFKGQTAILISVDGSLNAICGISDQLKPDSALAVRSLQSMGVQCWMVTGDNERTAHAIGEMVGIPKANIVAQALPETKVREVSRLQGKGRVVAMVGDGINDSPALVQADVGIAIGAGTEIAVEAASVVLVRSATSDVVVAIELSRAIFSRIKMNFVWALGYNTLMIPVAAGILYPWWRVALPPWLAGLAMALSSVSVVVSSLHLKLWRNKWKVQLA